jgi:hypothetical protein
MQTAGIEAAARSGRVSWGERSAARCALALFNRHALLLVPLLVGTFCMMAGWVARDYGMHYLFRDNQPLAALDARDFLYFLARSTRLFSQLYATALLGMMWMLFNLIEHWEEAPRAQHPMVGVGRWHLLPVLLLSLAMLVAALINRDANDASLLQVLFLSLLGTVCGLLIVAVVTWLGLWVSRLLRIHQLWTVAGLTAAIVAAIGLAPVVTPSKAIFIALAALVLAYAAFEVGKERLRFLLVGGALALLFLGSFVPNFKYRWPGMDQYYTEWSPDLGRTHRREPPAPLVDPIAALTAWEARQHSFAQPPKLVVVATSGGAYRAAFWTAIVLDRLKGDARLPGFGQAIRLMTGASGGMVGAAYYAAQATTGQGNSLETLLLGEFRERSKKVWLTNAKVDSLTPVVQRMIGLDFINAFLPLRNSRNRGQVLQDEWEGLQVTFDALQAGEREGSRPSLILTPYLVDSGKPLFISNLDLQNMIAGLRGEGRADGGGSADDSPDFAVEFFREFPRALKDFKLATAVRMSATFPFISPAVRLPLQNRSRVVDAGYFDNFGITAAAAFLLDPQVRAFIMERTSGVVLVRIMAFPEATKADEAKLAAFGASWYRLEQGLEQITSPLEGVLAARETRGQFANQLLLRELKELYGRKLQEFVFADAFGSYSWHLQDHEIDAMQKFFIGDATNRRELERLVAAWQDRPGSPQH